MNIGGLSPLEFASKIVVGEFGLTQDGFNDAYSHALAVHGYERRYGARFLMASRYSAGYFSRPGKRLAAAKITPGGASPFFFTAEWSKSSGLVSCTDGNGLPGLGTGLRVPGVRPSDVVGWMVRIPPGAASSRPTINLHAAFPDWIARIEDVFGRECPVNFLDSEHLRDWMFFGRDAVAGRGRLFLAAGRRLGSDMIRDGLFEV